MNDKQNVILHIDMNSYFAACEQQANPHLRGRAVGVCEHLGGIIIVPSTEAKRAGVATGMPVWEARKKCLDIVLLPVDPPKYRHITSIFLKIFSDYTALVERYSIDEAFLDASELVGEGECRWGRAQLLALEIKQRIRMEAGSWLTCSVGIGSNKLVAKIASDMDKPDGVTLICPQDIAGLYERLSLTDIPGIGLRMQRRLNRLGIFSVRGLASYPESLLESSFGTSGRWLHEMAHFRNIHAFTTPHQEIIKSMGHAYTLPAATGDRRMVKKLFFKLSEKVGRRMRGRNFCGSTVSAYARYGNSPQAGARAWIGGSHRIGRFTNDGLSIFQEAWRIFCSRHTGSPVRMAGVTVSNLISGLRENPLFERYARQCRATAAMDRVNDRYGEFCLRRALLTDASGLAGDSVGFGRMKEMQPSADVE